MAELPGYLKDGAMCFAGQTPGCVGTPLVPMLYVGANLMMNVAMLAIVRQQGALVVRQVHAIAHAWRDACRFGYLW